MLSYQQFIGKHPVKYRGLSAQQKRVRYDDYVRSQRNQQGNDNTRNNRTNRANRRTARATNRQNRNPGAAPQFSGSSAEQRYLAMFARPFDTDTVGLPVFPSPPSAKVTAWCRGTATVGTGSVGYILLTPTLASDNNNILYTTSAFAGTSFAGGAGVTSVGLTNLPVGSGNLTETSGVRGRVAMMAVRIRYTGTEQNRGGIIYPYVHPLHQDAGSQTLTWIASQEDYVTVPVTRGWTTAVWTPVHRTECDYYHTVTPPSHGTDETAAGGYPVVIGFTGSPGNTFEFQVVQHTEYTGQSTTWMSKTDNGVSVNLTDYVDKLQQPKLALRGAAAPGMRRDLRPLTGVVAPFVQSVGSKAASLATETLRQMLFGDDLR